MLTFITQQNLTKYLRRFLIENLINRIVYVYVFCALLLLLSNIAQYISTVLVVILRIDFETHCQYITIVESYSLYICSRNQIFFQIRLIRYAILFSTAVNKNLGNVLSIYYYRRKLFDIY